MKNLDALCVFFHLNFLNVRGILAQKSIMRVHFRRFSDVKSVGRYQRPSVLGQLVTSEPQHTRISHPQES